MNFKFFDGDCILGILINHSAVAENRKLPLNMNNKGAPAI